jgi:hypothetical protein
LKILQDQNERIAKKKKGRDRTGDPTQEKGDRTPGCDTEGTLQDDDCAPATEDGQFRYEQALRNSL